MSVRNAVGLVCAFVLFMGLVLMLVLIALYLLQTDTPLGVGLLIVCVLMVGALWGLDS